MGDNMDIFDEDMIPRHVELAAIKAIEGRVRRRYGRIEYNPTRTVECLRELMTMEQNHMHVEAGGRRIPLYKMAQSHLLNTIAFHARNLAELIRSNNELNGPESMLDAIMHAKDAHETSLKNVKQFIADGYVILGRYIMEAMRRGIMEEARARAMPYFEVVNELASMTVDGAPLPAITIEEAGDKEEDE